MLKPIEMKSGEEIRFIGLRAVFGDNNPPIWEVQGVLLVRPDGSTQDVVTEVDPDNPSMLRFLGICDSARALQ